MTQALPNLIIIGAMKCGTTALHRYLGRHPSIGMSKEKELNFFSSTQRWRLGVDWYARKVTARRRCVGRLLRRMRNEGDSRSRE